MLRQAINRCKRAFEAAKLAYGNKTIEFITYQKLSSWDFWQIPNSVLSKVESDIPPLFNNAEVLPSASHEAKLFLILFLRTLILMTWMSLYLLSLLERI